MRPIPILPTTLAALILALGAVIWSARSSAPREPEPAPTGAAAPVPVLDPSGATVADPAPRRESTDTEPALPPAFFCVLAPGESVELTIPAGLTEGIRCPNGSYLPLLNGVPRAGAISRARQAGPLPAVVAKAADQNGLEWYVHADGSRTTTHWATIEVEGEPREEVLTRHLAPLPDELEQPTTAARSNGLGPRLPGPSLADR